jgi:hypothetical protein
VYPIHKERGIMKIITSILIAIFLLIGNCPAVFAIHETIPAETQITLPGADAAALHIYITKSNPYTKWQLWPGKGKFYKGAAPHGALLTTYINDTAFDSVKKKTPMTDTAIIVMENYTANAKSTNLTVMYKIKGYNASKGDWFWAQYTTEGRVESSGKVETCIVCHEKRKNNDYLFSGSLR